MKLRASFLLAFVAAAGCATSTPHGHRLGVAGFQTAIDTNQVQFHKGTPPPPASDAIAIITKDGVNLLQQNPDGTTSTLGGGGGGTVQTDGTTVQGDGSSGNKIRFASAIIVLKDYKVTASGDQTDLAITGLNGDTDGDYDCKFDIVYKGGSGNAGVHIRPFGTDTSNLHGYILFNGGSGTPGGTSDNLAWSLGSISNASDQHFFGTFRINSKSGVQRTFYGIGLQGITAASLSSAVGSGYATDTTTVMSSVTLHMNVANSMRANSYLDCRALGNIL